MEIHIPHDVIAKFILSRLPVKSLLRFQAVCKQWSATISDPIFGHAHLQQSINSPDLYRSFFLPDQDAELRRAALETRQLRELSPLQYPVQLEDDYSSRCRSRVWRLEERSWCYCNGLFLITHPRYHLDYLVWNPSRRAHRELLYPYPPENFNKSNPRIGIYYHSSTKDYKVVIVWNEHNAVFSCKNNSWSEMRTNASAISFHDVLFSSETDCIGVPFEESVYWIRYVPTEADINIREGRHCMYQIVCFDGRDETLKIICSFDRCRYQKQLFSSRDGLYLSRERNSITKILPVWMEHEGRHPFSTMSPLCFIPNKVILFKYDAKSSTAIYDHSGTEATIILDPGISFDMTFYQLFPCIETLFLL